MYLLKRKSDGLYWRNRNNRGSWVEDPNDCKPFANKTSAMMCRGARVHPPYQRPQSQDEWRDTELVREYYAAASRWHARENRPARVAAFYNLYDIVEIQITIKKEDPS